MIPRSGPSLRTVYGGIAMGIVALDQFSKSIVSSKIELYDSITVIPGFFRISHVMNRGAAFSAFADARYRHTGPALIVFSVIVLAVIVVGLWRATERITFGSFGLALIMGGALGNLLDRVRLGSVIDFLAFDFGSYHWPDFNLADSAIVIGSMLLVLDLFFASRSQPHREP